MGDSFEIFPRKGEFLVFDPPEGKRLERIMLPMPSKHTRGVLVFPTLDGKIVAGPIAVDREDKNDWSVRHEGAGRDHRQGDVDVSAARARRRSVAAQ